MTQVRFEGERGIGSWIRVNKNDNSHTRMDNKLAALIMGGMTKRLTAGRHIPPPFSPARSHKASVRHAEISFEYEHVLLGSFWSGSGLW